MKKFLFALSLVAGVFLAAGCDKASSAGAIAGSAGKDMKDKGGEMMDKAKEELSKAKDAVTSKFGDLPKIEEAIGKLPAEAGVKAKAALESFKKLLAEFKDAPMDKIKDLGEKLSTAFADLKKQAGL